MEHVRFFKQPFTFTFTLNCQLGKTHNHRPRGDGRHNVEGAARCNNRNNCTKFGC